MAAALASGSSRRSHAGRERQGIEGSVSLDAAGSITESESQEVTGEARQQWDHRGSGSGDSQAKNEKSLKIK